MLKKPHLGVKSWLFALLLTGIATSASTSFAGTTIADTSKDAKSATPDSLAVEKVSKDDGYYKKPDWLNEVSVTFKEGYDSNIFLNNNYNTYSNKGSFFTSVTPKFELNFVPLLELDKGDNSIKTFTASYAPEFVVYHGAETEDYTAHRVGTKIKGDVDDFSYGLDNAFVYVQGRGDSLQFAAPYGSTSELSAYGAASFRERRDQFQDRMKLFVREDVDDYFIRPVANALYYDMHVNQNYLPSTYLNFPDRYDANTGLDLGYKVTKDYDVYLGYRYGHQFEGALNNSIDYSNDYQRVLLGFEGKPYKWLTANLEIGPDFRNYAGAAQDTSAGGTVGGLPNSDFEGMNKTTLYLDGGATFDVTSVDSIVLKAKQWQWVSSTGQATYVERDFSVCYKRKLTDELTSTVGLRYQESDYDSPNFGDDIPYSVITGLQYKLDDHWTFGADYTYSWCNSDSFTSSRQGREYDDHTVSLSTKWSL